MAEHIKSPDHWPGSLYGCTACEDECYCDNSLQLPAGETVPCLHCELEEERSRVEYFAETGDFP